MNINSVSSNQFSSPVQNIETGAESVKMKLEIAKAIQDMFIPSETSDFASSFYTTNPFEMSAENMDAYQAVKSLSDAKDQAVNWLKIQELMNGMNVIDAVEGENNGSFLSSFISVYDSVINTIDIRI